MSSRNRAVIDNGISTTVLPRNWLLVDGCSYSNWSVPECIFRTAMVRPFLENTLLSSKSLLGINYYLWSNTKSNNKCIPQRVFQFFSYLEAVPVLLVLRILTLSFSVLDVQMHADTRKHTFQCNSIQNHTIYSPGGNSIYKASLSLKHLQTLSWPNLISPSLSLCFPWSLSLSSF